MTEEFVFDCDALSALKGDKETHKKLADADAEYYFCSIQNNEIYKNTDNMPEIRKQIDEIMSLIEIIHPDTSGWVSRLGSTLEV